MTSCTLLLIIAVALDALLGDPPYPFHPVRMIGKTIQFFEGMVRRLNLPDLLGGILLTVVILGIGEGGCLLLYKLTGAYPVARMLFSLFIVYSCIALKDLACHLLPVVESLNRQDLNGSRTRLQKIVGRDTTVLDTHGVIQASIETASEGLVDGFLAPILWFAISCLIGAYFGKACLFGLLGILGYRIINTLDSMIGYKNKEYLLFGRFAAKLDDFANFIPARLSILFLFMAACLLRKDAGAGLETAAKDRLSAASPNAGHPESFVAGAFHIRLGGPVRYPFGWVNKPFIGRGGTQPTPGTIRQVLHLVILAGYLATGFTGLLLYLFSPPRLWGF